MLHTGEPSTVRTSLALLKTEHPGGQGISSLGSLRRAILVIQRSKGHSHRQLGWGFMGAKGPGCRLLLLTDQHKHVTTPSQVPALAEPGWLPSSLRGRDGPTVDGEPRHKEARHLPRVPSRDTSPRAISHRALSSGQTRAPHHRAEHLSTGRRRPRHAAVLLGHGLSWWPGDRAP